MYTHNLPVEIKTDKKEGKRFRHRTGTVRYLVACSEEPDALIAFVRVCGGAARQRVALPGDVLNLFKRYSWNLNDTLGGNDNEINPDVLGYIFEKYINQKEFGAYYNLPRNHRISLRTNP